MQGNPKAKKPFYKKKRFIVLIVIVAFVFVGMLVTGNDDEAVPTAQTTQSNQQQSNADASSQAEAIEDTVENVSTRDNSSAELTTLFSGTFTVGQDIPAGRYIITGDGQGNLFVYSNGLPIVNEILDDGTGMFGLGVPSVTTDLEDGHEIEISGINNVIFTPATTEMSTVLTTGSWVVGLDIPVGSYDATPTHSSESGNLFVYSQRGLPVVNEILAGADSDMLDFGLGVERIRVNLQHGQTIEISGISSVSFN